MRVCPLVDNSLVQSFYYIISSKTLVNALRLVQTCKDWALKRNVTEKFWACVNYAFLGPVLLLLWKMDANYESFCARLNKPYRQKTQYFRLFVKVSSILTAAAASVAPFTFLISFGATWRILPSFNFAKPKPLNQRKTFLLMKSWDFLLETNIIWGATKKRKMVGQRMIIEKRTCSILLPCPIHGMLDSRKTSWDGQANKKKHY